jgi:hypothetical protein
MHDRVIVQNLPPARYPYVRQLNGQEIRLLKMQWPISDDQLSFALLEHPLEANIKFTAFDLLQDAYRCWVLSQIFE